MKTTASCFLVLLLMIASIATAQRPCNEPPHRSLTDWAQFHFDDCLTGFNPYEFILSPATVGDLGLKWSYTTDTEVDSSPAVANGVMYVGSVDNNVYAFGLPTH